MASKEVRRKSEMLLTTGDVAKECGVERTTVWRFLLRHPEIGFVTKYGDRLVRREEVAVVRRVLQGGG
jgi:hypothetical protein